MSRAILTPDQRLRVFVSSTMRELAAERSSVKEAVEALRLTPVLFELGARPHPPRELYAAYLEQSHVFVGVYGEEYGWVAPGLDRSGIEDEYLLARGLPRLIYVREPAQRRDPRLEALLERIRAESSVSYRPFRAAEELRDLVAEDLAVLVSERFETGRDGAATGLRTAPVPVPVGPLVGREDEVAAVGELLTAQGVRLVTLVGPGGVGKSRLAFEVARVKESDFADGAVPVFLGPLRDPAVVPSTIAGALGLAEDPRRGALDVVEDALRDRSLLLVLDNVEHLLDAVPAVAHVLERCPAVRTLATSRQPLGLRGEHVLRVDPLALPETGDDTDAVRRAAAVRMFEERAAAAAPGFRVDGNAEAVAGICRRLDGLPLALELAASRIRFFSPAALLDELGGGLERLGRGARDASERHRTLGAAIRWSYDLLDAAEQQSFRRLGVFRGGWTPEAAAAVADTDLETLEALVEQSLATYEQTPVGPRLSMLETVREEAARLLDLSGERDAVRARHWSHYADVAQAMYEGPAEDRRDAVERMRPDLDNFRAALEHAVAAEDGDAVRLAGSLGLFWSNAGLMGEGRRSIELALAAAPRAPTVWRARALLMSSWLASDQGAYRDAEAPAAESLELACRAGDRAGAGLALRILGSAALSQGDLDRALELLEESVAELGAAGEETARIRALGTLARCLSSRGEFDRAAPLYEEALDYDRRHGHDDHLAAMLIHLGIDQRALGRGDDALRSLSKGASLLRRLGMSHNLAWALVEVARIHAVAGDRDAFVETLRECVAVFAEMDDRHGFVCSLELGAALGLADASYADGARLLGAAEHLREETGAALVGIEVEEVAHDADALRRALGDEAFERFRAEGRALSTAEALSALECLLADGDRAEGAAASLR